MTLDELKNKKVVLAVSGTTSFKLEDDLSEDTLLEILDVQAENEFTEDELLEYVIETYYDTDDFVENYADDYLSSTAEYEISIDND